MQKPGKSGRDRGLVDMSVTPPAWEYRRPPTAEEFNFEVHPDVGQRVHVRSFVYRGLVVDFALTHWQDDPPGEAGQVVRVDCCHSEIHRHQFHRARAEERTVIAPIPQDVPWATIDRHYPEQYDAVVDGWEENLRRWHT